MKTLTFEEVSKLKPGTILETTLPYNSAHKYPNLKYIFIGARPLKKGTATEVILELDNGSGQTLGTMHRRASELILPKQPVGTFNTYLVKYDGRLMNVLAGSKEEERLISMVDGITKVFLKDGDVYEEK